MAAAPMTRPAVTHVAVTVSELDVSVPWCTDLFGVEPVLDEDTGPFRHVVHAIGGTRFGLHGSGSSFRDTENVARERSAPPA